MNAAHVVGDGCGSNEEDGGAQHQRGMGRIDVAKEPVRIRRACSPASSGTCSAKVLLLQPVLSQNNRRTRSRIIASRPPTAVSDNPRS